MKPGYEKDDSDWARRVMAQRLGVRLTGKRKIQQWQELVCAFVGAMDHYELLRRECIRRQCP